PLGVALSQPLRVQRDIVAAPAEQRELVVVGEAPAVKEPDAAPAALEVLAQLAAVDARGLRDDRPLAHVERRVGAAHEAEDRLDARVVVRVEALEEQALLLDAAAEVRRRVPAALAEARVAPGDALGEHDDDVL